MDNGSWTDQHVQTLFRNVIILYSDKRKPVRDSLKQMIAHILQTEKSNAIKEIKYAHCVLLTL